MSRQQPRLVFLSPRTRLPAVPSRAKNFANCTRSLLALDCAVIGVSTDSVASHRAFAANHGFPFTLLSDEQGELARDFGVLADSVAERATFVIDRDGRVARAFRGVNPRGHAEQVLKFVRTMIDAHLMIGG